VTGDDVWCALYSEPEAGSDLSSVRTWAEPDGEGWRVSGQKVWTSGAHYADYGLLLARTSRDGKASQSLSTFVVPMRSPGVTVRPLISMTGDSKFNEVFLEDVRLDAAALIGTVGKGWAQIRVGTGRERMTLGSYAIGMWNDLAEIAEIARVADATPPDGFDSEWARLWMRVWTLRTTWLQMMTEDTPPADPRMSVLKLESSELGQQIAGLALRVTSGDAVAHERWTQRFFESRGATIAGGTSEIQRNVIAERVLGMPR
jgi:alkylation response protein AidB-like acyl-CoA dehydrogenase